MKKDSTNRYLLRSLNVAVLMLFMSAFFIRCASIMTPDGGPYDTLPPVIVAMTPDNFTTNFNEKRIYIEFDEFVQLKDQQKHFFVSPQMKTKPKVSIKGRGVVVTLGDSLAPNTTYALNFGSSIQDNNEGNPLYSMRYVFSTGDTIDSMVMSGYTEDSFRADSVSATLIYFFVADSVEYNPDYDSVMFNHTPAVIARAENNGIFLAQNLKPIDYRVYAYEDKNYNFIYEPGTDQIGFIDSVFNPSKLPDFSLWFDSLRSYVVAEPQLHFRMFMDQAYKRQILQESKRPSQHKAELVFSDANPQITNIEFDLIDEEDFVVEYTSPNRDSLAVWFNLDSEMLPDTIRGSVTYFKHDSIRNLVETTDPLRLTWRKIESRAQEREREKLEREREKAELEGTEWEPPKEVNPFKVTLTSSGSVNPLNPLTMMFEYPLIEMNTSQIKMEYISVDSVRTNHKISLERDSVNLRLWRIMTDLKEVEGSYELIIPSNAMTNIARQSNDSIVMNYTRYNPEKYSIVNVKFSKSPADESDYIVQLLNGKGATLSSEVVGPSGDLKFEYVPAGEIRLRVIQDRDKNGERSTGNMVKRLLPERVAYYEDGGESTFQTKENWEFDYELSADELFKPEDMQSVIDRLNQEESQRLKLLEEERAKKMADGNQKSNTRR
ncbi:MAG: Ig-like domain-containing protein [Rikenellaceae bacterium]